MLGANERASWSNTSYGRKNQNKKPSETQRGFWSPQKTKSKSTDGSAHQTLWLPETVSTGELNQLYETLSGPLIF